MLILKISTIIYPANKIFHQLRQPVKGNWRIKFSSVFFFNFNQTAMKQYCLVPVVVVLLCGCNAMKKLEDGIFIQQRTSANQPYPRVDSLLIVANGNSATQHIMDEVIPLVREGLKKRGVPTSSVFISYSDRRINEAEFDKKNYTYTLWIYEQDRKLQQLEAYDYLVPLAMKITDNRSDAIIWIATSIFNNIIRKQFYRERYAGTLVLLFRVNGMVR